MSDRDSLPGGLAGTTLCQFFPALPFAAGAGLITAALLIAAPARAGDLCFAPTPYTVGSEPSCVALADFDGDGRLDMAVANHDPKLDNRLSILINNGDGTFAPSVFYTTGDRPYWIATGDLDGDTDIDVAVTNFFGHTVSVFLNNGDGTLATQVEYAPGFGPTFITIADLNADAFPDLAICNASDDTVAVLLNNGDGTFARAVPFQVGPNPYGVTAADFNDDTILDLAVANHSSDGATDSVSVLLGNGDGTFGGHVTYPGSEGPVGVTAADLNNDGWPDLATADAGYFAQLTTIGVMINNGDGTFAPAVPYTVPTGPYSIAAADFNADGYADLVSANESNSVSVLINNGDGTFATSIDFKVGNLNTGIATGDLDGNGTPEVVTTSLGASDVWVLFNQYPGITAQPQSVAASAGDNVSFTVAATGPGPFTYQWRRDGLPLDEIAPYSDTQSDTLNITGVSINEQGSYDVLITNACGTLQSDAASLEIALPQSCVGDVALFPSGNGVVNIDDLLAVINTWGSCPACVTDIAPDRGNNVVNIDDLLAVINHWGPCP